MLNDFIASVVRKQQGHFYEMATHKLFECWGDLQANVIKDVVEKKTISLAIKLPIDSIFLIKPNNTFVRV